MLVRKASELEGKFSVPVNLVPAQKIQRYYNSKQKADLDVKTSINKIGEIVNLSQELNSQFWNNGKYNMNLYNDICKLAVLSGLEIDSAKKEVPVNSTYEINTLKKNYRLKKRPYFFKMITQENGYDIKDHNRYKYYRTSMDYLQRIMNKFDRRRKPKDEYSPFYMILKGLNLKIPGKYYDKRIEIIQAMRKYKKDLNILYAERDYFNAKIIHNEFIDFIGSMTINREVIYLLVKLIDNVEYKDIRCILMQTLFQTKNELLMSLIKESMNPICTLRECANGEIDLYGYKYTF